MTIWIDNFRVSWLVQLWLSTIGLTHIIDDDLELKFAVFFVYTFFCSLYMLWRDRKRPLVS